MSKFQFPSNINEPESPISISLNIIRWFTNNDTAVLDELMNLEMFPITPIFHNLPMVGLRPAVDIYPIFKFESIHALSLEI